MRLANAWVSIGELKEADNLAWLLQSSVVHWHFTANSVEDSVPVLVPLRNDKLSVLPETAHDGMGLAMLP